MMNKLALVLCSLALVPAAKAQQRVLLTANDYEHAQAFLNYNTAPLIDHDAVNANWLPGDRFWYRILTAQGSEYILADAAKGVRSAAFDQQRLAESLSKANGTRYNAYQLPFINFHYSPDLQWIYFSADGKKWKCNLATYECSQANADEDNSETNKKAKGTANEVVSPDGSKAAFIRGYNLWVRETAGGKETQLTTDGIKNFGYATDNAGWKNSDKAILLWSPDSRKIATFQQDERNVGDMYLVGTQVGKPVLRTWKYPLPGDKEIATIQRVIINVDEPKVIRLQIPADPHRATLSDDISSSGTFDDVNWNAEGTRLAFVSTSRDHKQEKVRIADAATGEVRELFEETVPTQYESGWGAINWRYLDKTNELIWFSERDDYGHLYLYDAHTGKVKNKITNGNYVVTKLLKVDEKSREVYFMADGLQAENPYFSQLCKVGFNGRHFTILTPESGNHEVSFSPDEKYLIDRYSKPDVPATTTLRNISGKLVTVLEKEDVSRLRAAGWKPLTPINVKAHDGKTEIYGLMFTPTNLDPHKQYPIIDYIYPGPQGGSVGSWSFQAARGDNQALAELGFIVIAVEGTSNPLRTKSFHDMNYGNMADNTLPDQVTAIRQLATRYSYIDTNRVGIWGHSGGGFATAAAMFRYPDFFKVGISESGNHDNRNYEDDWGERYDGLVSNSNYEAQANENYAKNLKGKLMLAHGMMDNNVPPQNTLLVVEALEKANKDYDLVIFPNSQHGYGPFAPYMMRRRWDYFVKNLMGAEAPKEFELKAKHDPRNSVK